MVVNQMSPEEAAENWDLPISAIYEAISYCESHQELLNLEADEECHRQVDCCSSFAVQLIRIS